MAEQQQQKLRSDSPLSNRIVRSFLHFLSSVEPAPGVDVEALEVVKQCLADVFNVHPSSADTISNRDSLIDIFQSQGAPCPDAPGPSSATSIKDTKHTEGEDGSRDKHVPDLSTDELFGQFIAALEQIRYFKSTPDGSDDPVQMDRASQVFYTAVEDLQRSGCETLYPKTLAESFKSQGNKAMQANHFSEAIEFYTFAIALNLKNAVYYCNRAAAFTQMHQYAEAIDDCLKAVEIDPNYSKAYSRLGFAYYAQGKYADALEKGFIKALRLDPNNEHVKENIRVAEQKLREEHRRAQHSRSYDSASRHGQPNNQSAGEPRTMPFNLSHVPPELASYLMNMTQRMPPAGPWDGVLDDEGTGGIGGNIDISFGGQSPPEDSNAASSHGPTNQQSAGPRTGMPFNLNNLTPEIANIFSNMTQGMHSHGGASNDIHTDGSININFGEQMPADVSGTLRSVMEMISGVIPGDGEDNSDRRPSS